MAENTLIDTPSYGHEARLLTEAETNRLLKDASYVSDYKKSKLEIEAKKNWDLFYKRNSTKFFKDRHWTQREFEELCSDKSNVSGRRTLFEVGCGVGNFIFPLIAEDKEKHFFFHACDFSSKAVELVKENDLYDPQHCHVFQCDITQDDITTVITSQSVDICTLIFVLSAINPEKMPFAVRKIFQVLKPGGLLLFRDYGLYDHAMLRFAPGHKLSENFYVRQDGTRAYYFTVEKIRELFCDCGFEEVNNDYVVRSTVNKKEALNVQRIFVQAKFRKPSSGSSSHSNYESCKDYAEVEDRCTDESDIKHSQSNGNSDNSSEQTCDIVDTIAAVGRTSSMEDVALVGGNNNSAH